jgi:hypothetical protein
MASRALAQKRDLAKLLHGSVVSVIGSLAGTLTFLMLVGVAAWIVINSGTGHPPWQ